MPDTRKDHRRVPAGAAPPLHRIILTGFMGSGKTTVGRLLAARLGWAFADLDDEVVRRAGMSVPELFARLGEPAFRREESAALADLLERTELVLALGGGAPEAEANRRVLRAAPLTEVVFLQAPFALLQARCAAEQAETGRLPRPLLRDAAEAAHRFLGREPFYREIATRQVDVSQSTAADIADALHRDLIGN